MKAILINKDNIVENIVVWDDSCVAPENLVAVVVDDDLHVSIGWIFSGNNVFVDPNPPTEVTLPPTPTLADLQSQLLAIQAQLQSL